MKRKSTTLFDAIDTILWEDWDPIGINENKNIRDEYKGYVPFIVNLKLRDANIKKIANHLYQLEAVSMGMCGSMERCEYIAQKINDL